MRNLIFSDEIMRWKWIMIIILCEVFDCLRKLVYSWMWKVTVIITSCRFCTAEGRQGVTAWRLFNSTSDFPVAAVASFAMDHIKQEQGRRIHLSCLRKQTKSGNLKIFLAVNVVSLICNFASRLVYSFFGFKKAAFAGWCKVNFVEGNYKSSVIGSLLGIAQQAGGVG